MILGMAFPLKEETKNYNNESSKKNLKNYRKYTRELHNHHDVTTMMLCPPCCYTYQICRQSSK